MDKNRIKRQVTQLLAAQDMIERAFEDLKNVVEFRESAVGNMLYREKLLAMLQTIIAQASESIKE